MRSMNKSPCFNCVEKIFGCHGTCTKYIEWSEERTAIRKMIQEEKRKENEILSEPFRAIRRSKKK